MFTKWTFLVFAVCWQHYKSIIYGAMEKNEIEEANWRLNQGGLINWNDNQKVITLQNLKFLTFSNGFSSTDFLLYIKNIDIFPNGSHHLNTLFKIWIHFSKSNLPSIFLILIISGHDSGILTNFTEILF